MFDWGTCQLHWHVAWRDNARMCTYLQQSHQLPAAAAVHCHRASAWQHCPATMQPADTCPCRFLRMPGGCYVEGGDHLANAFRWKETLGEVSRRPGHLNAIWGYWSTDGKSSAVQGPTPLPEAAAAHRTAQLSATACELSSIDNQAVSAGTRNALLCSSCVQQL